MNDPRTFDNPAINIDGIAAWAGYPIEDGAGWVLGTFCLISSNPYTWTDIDLHVLAMLAGVTSSEIGLRRTQHVIASARGEANDLVATAEAQLGPNAMPTNQSNAIMVERTTHLARMLSDAPDPEPRPERRR